MQAVLYMSKSYSGTRWSGVSNQMWFRLSDAFTRSLSRTEDHCQTLELEAKKS